MRLACYEDFETETGLYWPAYADGAMYVERAEYLASRFPEARILVAGCGWGFTVQHGRELGLDIWGCDFSDYAMDRRVSPYVFKHDVTAPLAETYDVIVTEDCLPMLELGEIGSALAALRAAAPTVAHWVSTAPRCQPHPSIPTNLTQQEWISVIGDGDEFWAVC